MIISLGFEQQWGLDVLGNWDEFDQDDDGVNSWDLEQKRYHNDVNEIDTDKVVKPRLATGFIPDDGKTRHIVTMYHPKAEFMHFCYLPEIGLLVHR